MKKVKGNKTIEYLYTKDSSNRVIRVYKIDPLDPDCFSKEKDFFLPIVVHSQYGIEELLTNILEERERLRSDLDNLSKRHNEILREHTELITFKIHTRAKEEAEKQLELQKELKAQELKEKKWYQFWKR